MPDKLKDIFLTRSTVSDMVDAVEQVYPQFERQAFEHLVFDGTWEDKELKQRMRHLAHCLRQVLPQDYAAALDILKQAAPSIGGFESIALPEFVGRYGLAHWELSLPALGFFTRFGSSEYGIRPFLKKDAQRAMAYMYRWAEDDNLHVRRFASEGCRPRLPWGMALPAFQKDPTPILPVLERLKDDESEYVRKSVANNLNDISKDHPEWVLDVCERWYGHSANTDWIVRHACRGLLKAGNRRALLLFGFADPTHIRVENLTLDKETLSIGEDLHYTFELKVNTEEPCKVRLELGVYYARPTGKVSRKVFAIREGRFDPGSRLISRKRSFADQSTRKHHAGEHSISIIVNGVEMAKASFQLTDRTGHGQ